MVLLKGLLRKAVYELHVYLDPTLTDLNEIAILPSKIGERIVVI